MTTELTTRTIYILATYKLQFISYTTKGTKGHFLDLYYYQFSSSFYFTLKSHSIVNVYAFS